MDTQVFFLINTLQAGGAERVVSTLAINFHNRKIPVTIVCLNKAKPAFKLPDDLKVVYLVKRNSNIISMRMFYAVLIFCKLTWLLISKKPDCVISFMTTANLWTGITCMLTHTDYIVSERTTPDHTINTFRGIRKWFSLLTYKNAKAVVLPSKGIENSLKTNAGFKTLKNYRIIKNPVNSCGDLSSTKVNNKRFILGVGRLSYEKGFDQLISAYKESGAKDIDLIIAGDGIERGRLIQQIESLDLQSNVKLVGQKENLQDYYSQAELFVLPSRNEGYPNALIEAMSMGCTCIAMDCEFGPAEIIKHNKNGLLIKDKDLSKLSGAISLLLKDQALKERLGVNARLVNNTNSVEAIARQWEELIFS
ncbi:MAG TPA: glycosyltransferase [Sphingobacteriaceae bacterium]